MCISAVLSPRQHPPPHRHLQHLDQRAGTRDTAERWSTVSAHHTKPEPVKKSFSSSSPPIRISPAVSLQTPLPSNNALPLLSPFSPLNSLFFPLDLRALFHLEHIEARR
ncbi:hypothetical protein VTO42DRAFT_4856 [Malbranchea cinnamomea]